jgi:hypothetical protein
LLGRQPAGGSDHHCNTCSQQPAATSSVELVCTTPEVDYLLTFPFTLPSVLQQNDVLLLQEFGWDTSLQSRVDGHRPAVLID